MRKVVLGVRGMDTVQAIDKVRETIQRLAGVTEVEPTSDGQVTITYDSTEVTAMDFIRALRKVGFLSGVE